MADGGVSGAVRSGVTRSGTGSSVTRSTPQLDAVTKWLNEVAGVHSFDLGGISEESQTKIRYGLEGRGRPVTKVNPYLVGRVVQTAQRYLGRTNRPTKAAFWDEVEKTALGVMIERLANAGGDLAGEWSAHPLNPDYQHAKARLYPGKPMGQATGALLRDVRSSGAFAVRGRR